jgi:hypothetical protein
MTHNDRSVPFVQLFVLLFVLPLVLTSAPACADATDRDVDAPAVVDPAARPDGWTDATHSNDVPPDLEEVFSDVAVKRIDIVLSTDDWQAMLDGTPGLALVRGHPAVRTQD